MTNKYENTCFLEFRYGVQTVPTTWIGLEKWIQEVWREKDYMLNNVYNDGKKFPALNFRQHKPQLIFSLQYLSLVAFGSFIYWSLQNLFFTSLSPTTIFLWLWILVSTIFMVFISQYTPGLQEIEILLEKRQLLKTIWSYARTGGKHIDLKPSGPSKNIDKKD